MTVWSCIVCFITGVLAVLAAQRCTPSRTVRRHRESKTQSENKYTRNFLRYDGTEQAETR